MTPLRVAERIAAHRTSAAVPLSDLGATIVGQATVGQVLAALGVDVAIAAEPISRWRPGSRPSAFTSAQSGGELGAAVGGRSVSTSLGVARQIAGAGPSPCGDRFPVGSGEGWVGRVAMRRAQIPTDPVGSAVQVEISWLNQAGAVIGTTAVYPKDPPRPFTVEPRHRWRGL